MNHIEGTFLGDGQRILYYQVWQPETTSVAVICIVHGFGEHSGRYMNAVNRLVPRGYTIYGYDLRGHGRSAGQRGHINSWSELREDTRAFLHLASVSERGLPVILWGHSLGGLVALEYALRDSTGLQALVISGAVLGQVGVSPLLFALSRIASRVAPRFSLNTNLDANYISRDPAVVKSYRDDPLVHSMGTARLGTETVKAHKWTQAHASDLRVPLLMLHGGADRLVPARDGQLFYDHVSVTDKERHVYEGCFHEPHNDICNARVLSDVETWVERHLA